MNIPNKTLQDKVRFLFARSAAKHDIHPDPVAYADERIDDMSQSEFLEALSGALEELLDERKNP